MLPGRVGGGRGLEKGEKPTIRYARRSRRAELRHGMNTAAAPGGTVISGVTGDGKAAERPAGGCQRGRSGWNNARGRDRRQVPEAGVTRLAPARRGGLEHCAAVRAAATQERQSCG